MGRPFAPNGRVVVNPGFAGHPPSRVFVGSGFHHGGHVIINPFPFGFGCGGFFPCNNAFVNPFFFSGSFFGSPFFPGSFWPGASWGYNYIPGFSSDYYYPPQPQAQQTEPVVSDNSNDIQLAVQMQRLTDEVEQLRADQARQQSLQQVPPGTSMSAAQPAAATTFVFRDGHSITAKNYAIAGQTLWIFSEHAARKVSLADIDRAATEELNAAHGVDVHLPEAPRP